MTLAEASGPLVLIEWEDSFGCSPDWEDLEGSSPEVMLCRSVGWLVYDGDDCKVIVPHIATPANQGCGDMTIPTRAVIGIHDLEVTGERVVEEGVT